MANTLGKEKGLEAQTRAARSTTRASAPVRGSSALTDEPRPDDSALAGQDENDTLDGVDVRDQGDESAFDDETGAERDTALVTEGEARVAHRPLTSGITVPAPLMANPVTRWLAEAYIELRKVTWPTPNAAWNMTLVVVAVSALVAVILGLADLGLEHLLTWLVSIGVGQ